MRSTCRISSCYRFLSASCRTIACKRGIDFYHLCLCLFMYWINSLQYLLIVYVTRFNKDAYILSWKNYTLLFSDDISQTNQAKLKKNKRILAVPRIGNIFFEALWAKKSHVLVYPDYHIFVWGKSLGLIVWQRANLVNVHTCVTCDLWHVTCDCDIFAINRFSMGYWRYIAGIITLI